MPVLAHIPVVFCPETLLGAIGLDASMMPPGSVERIVQRASAVARPKAIFRETFVSARGETTVTVDGATFTSRPLRMNLDNVERVFAYVATCGAELDRLEHETADLMDRMLLDAVKMQALAAATQHLDEHLKVHYGLSGTARMNPGSGDADVWPIEQQRELFVLLGDVERSIGVQLTETFLMIPNKTVSGIIFPTEHDFHSCQLCHRESCPNRRAPFDQRLWETVRTA